MGIFDSFFRPNINKLALRRDVPKLTKALNYKDQVIRLDAALAISDIAQSQTLGQDIIKSLITAIKDDSAIRLNACDILVKVGEEGIDLILAELLNNNSPIRDISINALGKIRNEKAIDTLGIIIYREDNNLRYEAMMSLIAIGQPSIKPLHSMLSHSNIDIRRLAADALQKIGYQPSSIDDQVIYYFECQNLDELAKVGEPALATLIAKLEEDDPRIWQQAAKGVVKIAYIDGVAALSALNKTYTKYSNPIKRQRIIEVIKDIGQPAVDFFVPMLFDNTHIDRENVAEILANLDYNPRSQEEEMAYYFASRNWEELCKIGESAIHYLVLGLDDKESLAREIVVRTLGEIATPATINPLISSLKDNILSVRLAGIKALEKIGNPQAILPLTEVLEKDDPIHHQSAVIKDAVYQALINIGMASGQVVKDIFLPMLSDKKTIIRETAAEILSKMGYKPSSHEENMTYYFASRNWEELCKIGEPAIHYLVLGLDDRESSLREIVVRTLGEIATPATIDPLIRSLKDKDFSVRLAVIEALGKIRNPQATLPLLEVLVNIDPMHYQSAVVQDEVYHALIKIGVPSITTIINIIGHHDNPSIRRISVEVLANIGRENPKVIPTLIEVLQDDDIDVKMAAINSLSLFQDKDLVETLAPLLKDTEPKVRQATVAALGNIGGAGAISLLTRAFRDKAPRVKLEAIDALAKTRDLAALNLLLDIADNYGEIRASAVLINLKEWLNSQVSNPNLPDQEINKLLHWIEAQEYKKRQAEEEKCRKEVYDRAKEECNREEKKRRKEADDLAKEERRKEEERAIKEKLNRVIVEIDRNFRERLRDSISRLQYTTPDNFFFNKNKIICQCASINETVEKAAPGIELLNALTKQKIGCTFLEHIKFLPNMSGVKVTVAVPGEGEPGVWIFKLRISGGEYIITT